MIAARCASPTGCNLAPSDRNVCSRCQGRTCDLHFFAAGVDLCATCVDALDEAARDAETWAAHFADLALSRLTALAAMGADDPRYDGWVQHAVAATRESCRMAYQILEWRDR